MVDGESAVWQRNPEQQSCMASTTLQQLRIGGMEREPLAIILQMHGEAGARPGWRCWTNRVVGAGVRSIGRSTSYGESCCKGRCTFAEWESLV